MKYLATAAIIAMTTTSAMAETVRATITRVEPNYGYRQVNAPVQQCQNVEVPIYGSVQGGGATGGDVLGGMILGALLGKGASGNSDGAQVGAVLGGIIAADKGQKSRQVITGYKVERQCHTTINTETERFVKNNKIWFTWNGIEGTAYTYNNYRTGQRIPVQVTLQAN